MQYIVPRWVYMSMWVISVVLQSGLATIMVRRGLARRFPAFFGYTVYEALLNTFLFIIGHLDSVSGGEYSNAFLAGGVGSAAFRFAVVCEIFIHVFRSYTPLKEMGRIIFRWATTILMIAAVLIVASTTGVDKDKYAIGLLIVDRTVNIIQCGLLVFLVVLASFLRFSWTSYIMGIALGFGVYSSAELCMSALRAQYGLHFGWTAFPVISSFTYLGCIGMWVVTLLLPEYRSLRIRHAPAQNLQDWNDTLERLLRQ